MKPKKTKLPRGLHWKSDSPFTWFTWRDDRGRQHRQSTNTDDPAEAFSFRQQFLEKRKQDLEQTKSASSDMAKWPLRRVAEEYFNWKCANSSTCHGIRHTNDMVRKRGHEKLVHRPEAWKLRENLPKMPDVRNPDGGRLVEDGSHNQLIALDGKYAKILGLRPRCTGPMEDENARASFGGSEAG
jgi:hypothetical protein